MTPNIPLMRSAALPQTILSKTLMVLAGSMFIALAAQIAVPFYPAPMTLQTLAVLIVGLSYGARLGALTLIAYVAEGAMGMPVFANGGSIAALMGPTAGFIVGFIGLAYLAGLAVEKGLAHGVVSTALVGVAASGLLYVPGLAWPMGLAALAGVDAGWVAPSLDAAWVHWISPFLLGDAVKALIAALVVTGAHQALRRG